MPGKKGFFLNYTETAMSLAMEDVRMNHISIRKAAKKFGVPRQTLKNKLDGKSPIGRKMGPSTTLTPEEEARICNWIHEAERAGFPVTKEQLLVSVGKYLNKMKRPCPLFKEGKPGKTFLKLFLRRNPSISSRISQNLTSSKVSVTKASLLEWFDRLMKELEDKEHASILQEPSRVFSCAETAFLLAPKATKVLAKKDEKNIYQQVNPDDKECLRVLVTGSASGSLAPTTVIFSYKRIPMNVAQNFPSDWAIGKTESGLMNCEAFFEFIADVFYPWLLKKKTVFPVILFVDGRASYLSFQASEFCNEKGIILVALHPNATQLIQPLDVAVFQPLKDAWRKRVHSWRVEKIENDEDHVLKKKDFAKLLHEVINTTVTDSMLIDGFRKCGLVPWNPQAVMIPAGEGKKKGKSKRVQYLETGLKYLNENINPETLEAFLSSGDTWLGDSLDTSLFYLWKRTKSELESLRSMNEKEEKDAFLPSLDDSLPSGSSIHQCPKEDDTPYPEGGTSKASPLPPVDLIGGHVPAAVIIPDSLPQHPSEPSFPAAVDSLPKLPTEPDAVENTASCLTNEKPSVNVPRPLKRGFSYKNAANDRPKARQDKKFPVIVLGKQYQEYLRKKFENRKNKNEQMRLKKSRERKVKKVERETINCRKAEDK